MNHILIESASRSPPGLVELVTLLEAFIRMEHLFEVMFMALGVPFGITFGHLGSSWDPFWGNFCSLRALLGTL